MNAQPPLSTQHLSIDELADAAEGLLDPKRAALAESHLAVCSHCQAQSEELREVTTTLRAEPTPAMPEAVAHRLNDAVAAESARRVEAWKPRPTLGAFGQDLPRTPKARWVVPALAAAGLATVVGLGAYVISANAGLNEPPVVAAVSGSDLGAQARALERASGGLSPHRFSDAWDCARKVTDGRITGLASSFVDGTPALLVYTKSDGSAQVTVVTGCGAGTPAAGPSAVLPR